MQSASTIELNCYLSMSAATNLPPTLPPPPLPSLPPPWPPLSPPVSKWPSPPTPPAPPPQPPQPLRCCSTKAILIIATIGLVAALILLVSCRIARGIGHKSRVEQRRLRIAERVASAALTTTLASVAPRTYSAQIAGRPVRLKVVHRADRSGSESEPIGQQEDVESGHGEMEGRRVRIKAIYNTGEQNKLSRQSDDQKSEVLFFDGDEQRSGSPEVRHLGEERHDVADDYWLPPWAETRGGDSAPATADDHDYWVPPWAANSRASSSSHEPSVRAYALSTHPPAEDREGVREQGAAARGGGGGGGGGEHVTSHDAACG